MITLADGWKNHKYIGTHRFEQTPFHWKGDLYMLENFCDYDPASYPAGEYPERTDRDGFYIWRVSDGKKIGDVVHGCYFASAIAHNNRLYVFAVAFDAPKYTDGVSFRRVIRYTTDDLIHWEGPKEVYVADPGCVIYNTATLWNGEEFIGCYETNETDRKDHYLFRFMESDDLEHFRIIPNAEYGRNKYVGGDSLYYVGGYYYLIFLHDLLDGRYETRLTRSKDLIHWEDAPEDRPMATPDAAHEINPKARPGVMELNASDLEIIEDQGRTLAFWLGGDQHGCSDMQMAEYPGTLQEALEHFFR